MAFEQLSNSTALLMSVVVFGLILYDAHRDLYRLLTGRTVVLLAILLWYLLEAVRIPNDSMPHTLRSFSQTQYDTGLAVVALALITFLIGYHHSRLRIFDDISRRLIQVDSDNVLWALFLSGCAIGLAPMIYFADFDLTVLFEGIFGLDERWTWKLQRGRFGGLRDALLELQMFLRAVVPLATVIIFTKSSTGMRRAICLFFITWMLLRANASGARSSMIPIVIPIAAAIFWKSSRDVQKWLIILGIPAALVTGYFYSAMVVAGRNDGEVAVEQTLAAADEYTGFEMFRELLYIVENVPDEVDYQWGKSYANQIINPIPRYFWEGKPVWDAGILLAREMGMVDENGRVILTNSPGFIGEAYLNFGILGVVFVPFFSGMVIRAWDRIFVLCGQSFLLFVVYGAGLANILASGRSISISTYYGMIALYILLFLIETFLGTGASPPRRGQRLGVRREVPA